MTITQRTSRKTAVGGVSGGTERMATLLYQRTEEDEEGIISEMNYSYGHALSAVALP